MNLHVALCSCAMKPKIVVAALFTLVVFYSVNSVLHTQTHIEQSVLMNNIAALEQNKVRKRSLLRIRLVISSLECLCSLPRFCWQISAPPHIFATAHALDGRTVCVQDCSF